MAILKLMVNEFNFVALQKLDQESVSAPGAFAKPANCPIMPTHEPALVRNVWQGTHV